MFLIAAEIEAHVAAGDLKILPFRSDLLKPSSYVLRLGRRFALWKQMESSIRPWSVSYGNECLETREDEKLFSLRPGEFVLASTEEAVSFPQSLLGMLSTLSHVARCGVSVLCNSNLVSPGFGGQQATRLTLEISNHNRQEVVLEAGMPICHLAFARVGSGRYMSSPVMRSVYEGEPAPLGPRMLDEFRKLKTEERN